MSEPAAAFVVVLLFMAQLLAGASVVWGAFVLMAVGTDQSTSLLRRMVVLVVFTAGCMYCLAPFALGRPTAGGPDIVFAAVVGYALMRHGRQVRGVLDGDWDDTHHLPEGNR